MPDHRSLVSGANRDVRDKKTTNPSSLSIVILGGETSQNPASCGRMVRPYCVYRLSCQPHEIKNRRGEKFFAPTGSDYTLGIRQQRIFCHLMSRFAYAHRDLRSDICYLICLQVWRPARPMQMTVPTSVPMICMVSQPGAFFFSFSPRMPKRGLSYIFGL